MTKRFKIVITIIITAIIMLCLLTAYTPGGRARTGGPQPTATEQTHTSPRRLANPKPAADISPANVGYPAPDPTDSAYPPPAWEPVPTPEGWIDPGHELICDPTYGVFDDCEWLKGWNE